MGALCVCHHSSKGSWPQMVMGSKRIYSYFVAQVRIKVTVIFTCWRMPAEQEPEEEMNLDLLNVQSALQLQVSQDVILLQFLSPCITQHRITSPIWHSGWCCGKRDVWFHGRGPGLSQDERPVKRWIWLLVFSFFLPPHPLILISLWFKCVPIIMAESFAKLLGALGCACCCEQ